MIPQLMDHLSRSWTALRLSLAAVALLACWWGLMRAVRVHQPPRVLFLGAGVEGLDPSCGPGVARLLVDAIEVSAGATVLGSQASDVMPSGLRPGDLLMKLGGRRVGDALSLTLSWTTPEERSGGLPWHELILPPAPPWQTLQDCLRRWPFPAEHSGADRLAPRDPEHFWLLAQAMSVSDDQTALTYLQASRELADKEPASAAAWANLGEQLYRSLWASPGEASTLPQNQALDAFDRALALVPGYPRAAFLRGMMETDVGNQREALRGLVEARRRRPWVPDFYSGLAYAGRTSGLLDGAETALRARSALMAPLPDASGWFAETTWLYTGQWDRFEESLQAHVRAQRDPGFLFYLGYLALLHEDPERAKGYFNEGASIPKLAMPFRDLCAVYAAALDGRREEGLARLRKLEEGRGSLRIPDGELTFKVAEAYAFLGRPDMGIECAGRAFAQGFGCTRWYEASPIFAPARQHPRWAALQQHLRERQALLEKGFDTSDFKPAAPGFGKLFQSAR